MPWIAKLLLLALVVPSVSSAQAVMESTRVIYLGKEREVLVRLRNPGTAPAMTQVWIGSDDARELPEASRAPFAVLPPLLRLEPGQSGVLRIRRVGTVATPTREQLYWLNLQDLPPKRATAEGDDGRLDISLRSRFKLLYRPEGFVAEARPERAVSAHLVATASGRTLVLRNTSRQYFHLGQVAVEHAGGRTSLDNPYVPPEGETAISIPADVTGAISRVHLLWIDDGGRMHALQRDLAP